MSIAVLIPIGYFLGLIISFISIVNYGRLTLKSELFDDEIVTTFAVLVCIAFYPLFWIFAITLYLIKKD